MRKIASFCCAAALAITLGAARDAQANAGHRVLIAGTITLGVFHSASALGAVSAPDDCAPGAATVGCLKLNYLLALPVAGPFLQMAYLEGNGNNAGRALLFLDGTAQLTGLLLMAIGGARAHRSGGLTRLGFAPLTLPSGSGLLVSGRF